LMEAMPKSYESSLVDGIIEICFDHRPRFLEASVKIVLLPEDPEASRSYTTA
jgi:hypothetical protein